MSPSGAVLRRVDPWAALLLGVLLTLGVVILLATPGPWHKVVGTAPAVKLAPPAPDDVAVFVLGGRNGRCSGIVWLHTSTEKPRLTAVVVSGRVRAFAPGAGHAALADIVDAAGPGTAATALGDAVGVEMDAWLTLQRQALKQVLDPMFPMGEIRAARPQYRVARSAWLGHGGAAPCWRRQYQALRDALPRVPFQRLGVVAFSNYVLGFGFVDSDLTLQGATSLGETLKKVTTDEIEVRAAAVVIETSGGGTSWRLDESLLIPLRQSLAFGLAPPDVGVHITRRERPRSVLVAAAMPNAQARLYASQVRRSVARSAGEPVEVRLVTGGEKSLAGHVARALAEHPALAVLVGPPLTASGDGGAAAVERVAAALRLAGQEAVVAGPLPGGSGPATTPSATTALTAAVTGSRLPVAPYPVIPGTLIAETAGDTGSATGMSPRGVLLTAARANAQTLVRACWPGALAPRLLSTRTRFSFVTARNTEVRVAFWSAPASVGGASSGEATPSSSPSPSLSPSPSGAEALAAAEAAVIRIRQCGFAPRFTTLADVAWEPSETGTAVYYRRGLRAAARVVVADLGLPPAAAVADDKAPEALLVVVRP